MDVATGRDGDRAASRKASRDRNAAAYGVRNPYLAAPVASPSLLPLMRTHLLASILTIAGAVSAQTCGTLAFTGTGAAGTSLTIDVTGATAGGFVTLGVSQNTGTTTINVGSLGLNLTLGLDSPIIPVPLGRANSNGDISRTLNIPSQLGQQFSLQGQAVTLTLSLFPFSLSACASNVAAFTIG